MSSGYTRSSADLQLCVIFIYYVILSFKPDLNSWLTLSSWYNVGYGYFKTFRASYIHVRYCNLAYLFEQGRHLPFGQCMSYLFIFKINFMISANSEIFLKGLNMSGTRSESISLESNDQKMNY